MNVSSSPLADMPDRYCAICEEVLDDADIHATTCEDCRDVDSLEDILAALTLPVMARFDAEFSPDTTLNTADARRAVTNSTRHDCVAWEIAKEHWKVGDNPPDRFVGKYFSKGEFGQAQCRWWPSKNPVCIKCSTFVAEHGASICWMCADIEQRVAAAHRRGDPEQK